MKIQSIEDLKREVPKNLVLQHAFKDDPIEAVKLLNDDQIPNTTVYKMVVASLGSAVLIVIIGIVILSLFSIAIESSILTLFTAIASGCIGALSGLLAPTPR